MEAKRGSWFLLKSVSRIDYNPVGLGIVICLSGIINTANTDLAFLPLAPSLEAHASLIWSKSNPLSAAARAFLDTLKKLLPTDEQWLLFKGDPVQKTIKM